MYMKLKIFLPSLLLISALVAKAEPPAEEGKAIFMSRCASCHNVNKPIVGPALAGIHERRSMDWIVNFVQSSQSVIKTGDKEATALFASYNNIPMPDHKDLSADKIRSIVDYIKSQSTAASAAEKAPFDRPGKLRPDYMPVSAANYWFFAGLLASIALLVGALLFYVWVKQYQRNLSNKN